MLETLRNEERRRFSMAHIITRGAEIHPDRVAIDDRLNQCRFSYRELEQRINRLALGLIRLGIGRGDLVAIMFYNEHAMVESLLAAGRIGAIACPVNVRLLPREASDYARFHGVRAILTRGDLREKFDDVPDCIRIVRGGDPAGDCGTHVDYESLLAESDGEPPPACTLWEDPFRMIQTGGTTGPSKGVLHSHAGVYTTTLSIIAEMGIGRGWKTIVNAPVYHGAGMDWNLFPVLWRGGTVIFPPSASFSPTTLFSLLRETEAEYLLTVPAINIACRQCWDGRGIDSVRVAVSTSAPTPPAQCQWLREMFPRAALSAGSGISESLNMAFQSPGEFLTHPESVGEPYLDTRVRIVDPEGRTLPAGCPGEICLRGFNTGLSYHLEPDKSAATWRRIADDPEQLEWCFTGDIGVLDAHGRLSIVDRAKDVIISGGETIPSVEIEGLFQEHPAVRECAAIGMPDERWGELVTLVVAPAGNPGDLGRLTTELGAFARERIAPYKRPRRFIYVEALPRSHFGKVLKRTLRDMTHEQVYEEQTAGRDESPEKSGDEPGRPAQSM